MFLNVWGLQVKHLPGHSEMLILSSFKHVDLSLKTKKIVHTNVEKQKQLLTITPMLSKSL